MRLVAAELDSAVVLEKVTRPLIGQEAYSCEEAAAIASHFALSHPIRAYDFPEKGNINQHTFLVVAGTGAARRELLLQRINDSVFTRPRRVMGAMMASIRTQNAYLSRFPTLNSADWHVVELIPTRAGAPYLEHADLQGTTVWRLMVRIPECRTYKSLGELADGADRLQLAQEAGRGLALYHRFTAEMDTSDLDSPLPGYRDTRLYYDQLLSVLAGSRTLAEAESFLPSCPDLRHSTDQHFLVHLSEEEYLRRTHDPDLLPYIALARAEERFGTSLLRAMSHGSIRTVAIHGDTKLDNFLFCSRTGRVKALIDLDTIMPHTWLSDWGDMVRSLVNVAGEKEADPARVDVDLAIFEAIAQGFLGGIGELAPSELNLMVDAVQVIALELGVRFLVDYLRGDTYFRPGPDDPPDVNKRRAMVQLTLFQRLRQRDAAMRAIISGLAPERYAPAVQHA